MAVAGTDVARVLELHEQAVAAVVAGHHHPAGARRQDRRTHRRAEIDAGVHRAVAQDRMLAHAEARGDVAGIHRRAQERAHDALAPGVVELVGAVVRSEADHGDGAFPEMELAREQSSPDG